MTEAAGANAPGPSVRADPRVGAADLDPDLDLGPAASRLVRDRDRALAGAGWERRFIGGPPRLLEMTDLYQSLGYEVRTESLDDADLQHECAGCTLALTLFRIVYTRRPR